MNEKPELRLTNNIEPTNYDITLEPDLTNASFTGNASINLKVNKQTNKINFHANDLDVKNIPNNALYLLDNMIQNIHTYRYTIDQVLKSSFLKQVDK